MNDQNSQNNQTAFPENVNNPVRRLTAPVICHNPHCGFQTFEPMTRCPHCKRPMWTTNNFRLIMSVLLVLGFVLLAAGVGFGVGAYRTYYAEFGLNKNSDVLALILALLSIFFSSFGLAVLAAGGWAVIFGKANWTIIKAVLGFMLGMLIIAGFGRLVLYFLLD